MPALHRLIQELFSGNRELFTGCHVYDTWNWVEKHPVIKISFSDMNYRELRLKKALNQYSPPPFTGAQTLLGYPEAWKNEAKLQKTSSQAGAWESEKTSVPQRATL
jgi:hypothetical protein